MILWLENLFFIQALKWSLFAIKKVCLSIVIKYIVNKIPIQYNYYRASPLHYELFQCQSFLIDQ